MSFNSLSFAICSLDCLPNDNPANRFSTNACVEVDQVCTTQMQTPCSLFGLIVKDGSKAGATTLTAPARTKQAKIAS